MVLPFPNYLLRADSHLAQELPQVNAARIKRAVAARLSQGGSVDETDIDELANELAEPEIELGEREFQDPGKPWVRKLHMPAENYSGVHKGIYPGQPYTHAYGRFRLEITSGRRLVPIGSNGGPVVDPDFLSVKAGWISIRAADDSHRDQLIADIENHVERANAVVQEWNRNGLRLRIEREVKRQAQERDALAQRTKDLVADGFTRAATPKPNPRSAKADNDTAPLAEPKRPTRILVISANPTVDLDIEEEIRAISEEIRTASSGVEVIQAPATRPADLVHAVREYSPRIVHFSGHGSSGAIVLRNDSGDIVAASKEALAAFLDNRGVELVVLNACYSNGVAAAVVASVPTVIGTTDQLSDDDAVRFSTSFYRTLLGGGTVADAVRDGKDVIGLSGGDDVFNQLGDGDLTITG